MKGIARIPGSKSLSNRALLLAAMAEGSTILDGMLYSDDVMVMMEALRNLGVKIEVSSEDNTCIMVEGTRGRIEAPSANETWLWMGNAGTAMRSLTAMLCAANGKFVLYGEPRMHERPIQDLVDALNGVDDRFRIEYLENYGYPPLRIITSMGDQEENDRARKMGNTIKVSGKVSSQFVSAVIMAAPFLFGSPTKQTEDIVIRADGLISAPYVEMTVRLASTFGLDIAVENENENDPQSSTNDMGGDAHIGYRIAAGFQYRSPGRLLIEPDASSASYFLACGALGSGPVTVRGLSKSSSLQGDVAFVDVLELMGANVSWDENAVTISRGPQGIHGVDVDLNHIPDAAMTIAPMAVQAKGETVIRGIGSWRVKECNRLDAMATELRKVGAIVETGPDWIRITPPYLRSSSSGDELGFDPNHPVRLSTYDDHRMAMSLSLLSVGEDGREVEIENPGCVSKTFPGYFEEFARMSPNLNRS